MSKTIYFYGTRSQFGCFSNFSRHSFDLDGIHWKTSEHYFQAHKFAHIPDYFSKIKDAKTPKEAANLGRSRKYPLRPDWEIVKDDTMRQALKAKFGQNKSIRDILLSTDNNELVENTTGDYYWGCGTYKTGLNKLGKLLMELRDELRKKQDKEKEVEKN